MAAEPKSTVDAEARAAVEGTVPGPAGPGTGEGKGEGPAPSDERPPAGTHADPALTNPLSTPGTGALTPPGGHDDMDSTSS